METWETMSAQQAPEAIHDSCPRGGQQVVNVTAMISLVIETVRIV
jgi:hypothetical protein